VRILGRVVAPAVFAAVLVLAAPASAAPPANDLFASAELVTGSSASISATNAEATKETGEPNHRSYSGGRSLWYRWVAPDDGTVTIDGSASSSFTAVAAYTGLTVDGLTAIGATTDYRSVNRVRFSAVAGRTYYVAADTLYGGVATVELTLELSDPPANDPFASPEILTGTSASGTGDTSAATREAGEPRPGYSYGAGSVWYEWTAPASGGVVLDTAGSNFNTAVGVYTGDDVAGLVQVAASSSSYGQAKTSFSAVAGTTYRIQVDGYYSYDLGAVKLALSFHEAPPNDMFSAATALPGEPIVTAGGSTAGAGAEPGEPSHQSYTSASHSVWYAWTAPKDGSLTLKGSASFQVVLAVYTGESVAQLTRVVNQPQDWNGGSEQIRVRVHAGVTYRIAVDAYASYYHYGTNIGGEFGLSLELIDSPDNDDFADAETIVGLDAEVAGSNVGATQEPCEPVHDDNYYDPSVWYEWTAPASGGVTLDMTGSEFNTVLGIYTGDSLCDLVRVPTTRTSPANVPAKRRFRAAAGVTYRIAVDGARARWGNFKLSFDYTPPPPNDMFAAAELLTGSSAQTTGNNIGATGEDGEPNPGGTAGASVWYSWTAPKDGLAQIALSKTDFAAEVAVYTGDSVGTLASIRTTYYGYYSKPAFRATAGTTYRIAIHGGMLPSRGEFALALEQFDPPPNDDFEDAIELIGKTTSADGTTAAASREEGEPNHVSAYSYYNDYPASVWYTWTAPATGRVTLNRSSVESSHVIAVYTGDAVNSLTRIAGNYYGALTFQAQAGTKYRLAVSGTPSSTYSKFNLTLDAQPPPNDDLADAEILSGADTATTGSNRNATAETGEPQHGAGTYSARSSVWYRWTAPADGTASVDLGGTDFTPLLAIYTGSSIDSLSRVSTFGSDWRRGFEVTKGTTYLIAVDGAYEYSTGSIKLALAFRDPPPNDDFSDAIELSGATASADGTTANAGLEPNEPRHNNYSYYDEYPASVWYSWTAPVTGKVSITRSSAGASHVTAVYTGDSLDSLTRIAGDYYGNGATSFRAQAGTTYRIAVAGYVSSTAGAFTLEVEQNPPPNDDFANAEELTGTGADVTGSNRNGGAEPSEPPHGDYGYGYGPNASVWYRWTAPDDGSAAVDVSGSEFSAVVGVYTGSQVASLTRVTTQGPASRRVFKAVAGTTYYLAVDGYSWGTTGKIKLALDLYGTPQNDGFANAEELTGSFASAAGSTLGATREPGEPWHYSYASSPSVWYRWTAPHTASVDFAVQGYDFPAGITLYSGKSLDSLSRITGGYGFASFTAQEGSTYYIAVDGYYSDAAGAFTLSVSQPWWDDPGGGQQEQEQEQQQQQHYDPPREQQQQPEQSRYSDTAPPAYQQQPPAWTPPADAPLWLSATFPDQKLAPFLSNGLVGTAGCSKSCQLDVVATLDKATAKKAGLRGAKLTSFRASVMVRATTITPLQIRVPKALRAKLRGVKSVPLTVQVTATAGSEAETRTFRVRVKR
jgi:hypothetical protein